MLIMFDFLWINIWRIHVQFLLHYNVGNYIFVVKTAKPTKSFAVILPSEYLDWNINESFL